MREVSSLKNPIIKEIKSLYNKKDRWNKSLFIIEGIKIIEEAIFNNIELKYIIITDKMFLSEDSKDFL